MVHALRSFLRYIFLRGDTTTDLSGCVPSVARWRAQAVPPSLKPEELDGLMKRFDLGSRIGLRDFAIVSLMMRFGLRVGEVASLTLNDVNWQSAELTIHGKGAQIHRLPLLRDVGRAIAQYLQSGRPPCSSRHLFVSAKAPHRSLAPASVSGIVKHAVIRAGLKPARSGGHLLRHSVATHMLKRGVSLQEIGQILHHRSPDTTLIYAKVDLPSLQSLALPWPDGNTR